MCSCAGIAPDRSASALRAKSLARLSRPAEKKVYSAQQIADAKMMTNLSQPRQVKQQTKKTLMIIFGQQLIT